jgi:signal transduction histidine kinase
MRPIERWLKVNPVLIVTLALLSATVLVIYLQRGAFAALEEQSVVIREKILEQTAQQIALEIRAAIEEPAYETLRPVKREELLAGGLPRVLSTLDSATNKYPLIDRFFVWSEETERTTPGEVLFFEGDASHALARDAELGPRIYRELRATAVARKNYAALQNRAGDCTYDVLAHYYWAEPVGDHYTMLLGYVICAEKAGARLLHDLHDRNRTDWLNRIGGDDELQLRVYDEQRRVIFGSAPATPGIVGRASVRAQFYPDRFSSSLAVTAPPLRWTIEVGSASPVAGATRTQGVWLLGFSVLLILVALAVAVRGQKQAAELARMQSDFVSHVSHQLRTPLSLVTAVTDTLILNRVKSPEKTAQYLDIVRTETARLSTLVERILEFSRVAGTRVYQLESVDLTGLVRETAAAFAQTPAAEAFAMRVDAESTPCLVRADPVALEQVLVNLLDNAVKYSDVSREVIVRVRSSGSDAVVEVEDHGLGIAATEHNRIFERFYRGASAATQRGFGLGLAIVKEIVVAHRGHIEVESSPHRGTLIRVRLPRQRARGWRAVVNLRAIRASRGADAVRHA